MRLVRSAGRARRGARARARRGEERVRRRHAPPRALHRAAAPHRDPDPRRHARQRRAPLRARVLDPAPPPEDRRGGAVAGARRRAPRRDGRRRGRARRARSATSARARSSSSPTRRAAFYFLEVNTRLQVEHPVTELIDRPRSRARADPHRARRARSLATAPPQRGWAIEVRLCAEDPERDFLPTTGTLLAVDVPADACAPTSASSPAARSASTTTRCSARSSRTRTDARRGRRHPARRARARRGCPASSRTASCSRASSRTRRSSRGELHTHFLEQHAGELAAQAARPRAPAHRRDRRDARRHRRAPRRTRARAARLAQRPVRGPAGHVSPRRSRHRARLSPRRPAASRSRSAARPTHVSRYGVAGDQLVVRRARRPSPHGSRVVADEQRADVLVEGALITLDDRAAVPRSRAPGRRGRARRADARHAS